MPRRFALLAVSATICLAAVSGCGPQNPAPSTRQEAPTPAVGPPQPTQGRPTAPTTGPTVRAARKTISREDLKAWLQPKESPGGKWEQRTPASVKATFGTPDSSQEVKRQNPGELLVTYLVFTYKGLTVDAKGSEKVDAECRIYFNNDLAVPKLVEFVP